MKVTRNGTPLFVYLDDETTAKFEALRQASGRDKTAEVRTLINTAYDELNASDLLAARIAKVIREVPEVRTALLGQE